MSVFGLGSRSYHTFCKFAHDVNDNLIELGAQQLLEVGEGDELYKQAESFQIWTLKVIQTICNENSLYDQTILLKSIDEIKKELEWDPKDYRVVKSQSSEPNLIDSLSSIHKRKVVPCRLHSKKELQSHSSSRSTLLIRLEHVEETGLLYDPGDHVIVYPSNDEILVNKIIGRMNTRTFDDVIEVEKLGIYSLFIEIDASKSWRKCSRLPPCSVRTALKHFIDISAPPTQELLTTFALMSSDSAEKQILQRLSTEQDLYKETLHALGNPSVCDVLDVFVNVKITAELIIEKFPIIRPRYYSVSSCLLTYANEIHLTVALQQHFTSGKVNGVKTTAKNGKHSYGLCSGWFRKMKAEDVVPLSIKR
ncbi:nitric oxide synthase 1-like [Antedon mediterranea]|uniref:nitric oxide synthase 1-like n=1 Tax=Antedon mediterranea TaxID=105859 RepID=UPI003AF7FF53